MLICDEVVKKYHSCVAVNHVNVRLDDGRIYALLGPNGSGKTTLMKMIMGLIKPDSGNIVLDGCEISPETKADIVYMPTENYFYPYMHIKDVVNFYKDFYKDFNEQRLYDLMNMMGLRHEDKIKTMSTGMLAKLKVAVALSRDAKVIMLDEPLNGIDILAREVIINSIIANAGGGKTIVISSHLVDELENVVSGALFMKAGEMVLAGDANQIRESNQMTLVDLYKKVYGWGGMGYAQTY